MKSKVLVLLAVALLAGPMAANALVITISGQGTFDGQWDVTTTVGTYDALLPTLDDQVWWGNQTLAIAFADALGNKLGSPNNIFGPLFAYSDLDADFFNSCEFPSDEPFPECGRSNKPNSWTFATASLVAAVPEPGTLALLILGLAGLGVTRRRKAD